MSILLTRVVETLIYPPAGALILVGIGWWAIHNHKRWGKWLLGGGVLYLYLAAAPLFNSFVFSLLEPPPITDPNRLVTEQVQAIVVLGGPDRYRNAPEYGGDRTGRGQMERLRYGAHLQRHTDLPIAVLGGDPLKSGTSEADLMADTLEDELGVTVKWRDGQSRTTFENAKYAARMLQSEGVERIALVTHAWHMHRSVLAFENQGFKVLPAPTAFTTLRETESGLLALLPNADAMARTRWAMHEMIGLLWYLLLV